MVKKEEVISFVWQHILLLVSLYVMTFGVAACVRSQLGCLLYTSDAADEVVPV